MRATVVALPTAAPQKVRQCNSNAAQDARKALLASQSVVFHKEPVTRKEMRTAAIRAFEVAYREAVKFRDNLDQAKELHFRTFETNLDSKPSLRAVGALVYYRNRIFDLANCPAMTLDQARRKREIIGDEWLNGEDEWFDYFRDSVARDEERLKVKAR